MKKPLIILFVGLLLFVICSCTVTQNDCHNSYTVSGTLLDGKTGSPITDSGTTLMLYEAPDYDYNSPGISVSSHPDKNGRFSMAYKDCWNYKLGMTIGLIVPHKGYNLFDPYDTINDTQIPWKQNLNQTWTAAINGWLVLYLQPLGPLLSGDTLVIKLSFPYSDSTHVYKFLTTQTGVLDSAYLPTGIVDVNWGRGEKNMNKSNEYQWLIKGDPNISRYTIKY